MRCIKVLVADDFEGFRRIVCSELQPRAEFQVAEASDGLEAIQKIEELQPDLMLLDISMPKLNGMDVARRARTLTPTARILFFSIESDPHVVRGALDLGAGYIHKPRLERDLIPAINAVLSGGRFISSGLDLGEGADAHARPRHEILFCRDDAAALDGLARFIAAALNSGDAALVVVTKSHQEGLLQRLRAQSDIDSAIQRETFISLDADEKLEPPRLLEAIKTLREAASRAGKEHAGVALCGEGAGRLWAEGKTDEAIGREQLCDHLARTYGVHILCTYPMPDGREDELEFKSIRAGHTASSFQ